MREKNQPALLVGERVTVRSAAFDDMLATRHYRFSRALRKYANPDKPVKSIEEEQKWWRDDIESGRCAIFAICLKDDTVIGFINAFCFNEERTDCETGIAIFPPDNYGRGYGEEAYRLLLSFLNEAHQLHTTHIYVATENGKAIRLYEKLQYEIEDTVTFDGKEWFKMRYDF